MASDAAATNATFLHAYCHQELLKHLNALLHHNKQIVHFFLQGLTLNTDTKTRSLLSLYHEQDFNWKQLEKDNNQWMVENPVNHPRNAERIQAWLNEFITRENLEMLEHTGTCPLFKPRTLWHLRKK